ncbi:MAG: S-layer homology domain-containing protein, partial [Oscillospiraceae bacterium]|nr:S-layer homology domain-containing protein [Oscillospiraceae bacterium]
LSPYNIMIRPAVATKTFIIIRLLFPEIVEIELGLPSKSYANREMRCEQRNTEDRRIQTMTFLHRASGAPSVTGRTAFTDVPQTAYYANAVKWAVDHKITTGTSAAAFSPNASCTRA